MQIYEDIKKRRQELGLTQAQLGQISGISTPMVHLIEAGKGNPSVKTLTKALNVLGLNLEIKEVGANWDLLALCGVPISIIKNNNITPTSLLLISQLKVAINELNLKKDFIDGETLRKRDALVAFILALKLYYPTFFKKEISKLRSVKNFIPNDITGKHIKLARISKAFLSEYL